MNHFFSFLVVTSPYLVYYVHNDLGQNNEPLVYYYYDMMMMMMVVVVIVVGHPITKMCVIYLIFSLQGKWQLDDEVDDDRFSRCRRQLSSVENSWN